MSFRAFVESSGLPKEDKEFWLLLLSKIDGEQLETFEDFVQGDEENLKVLTGNIKSKRKAFENLDEGALDEIIQKEQ